MEITWYGHSCFRLTERNYATVVTDPYDNKSIGYSPLKLRSDIVTVSHDAPGHSNTDAVKMYEKLRFETKSRLRSYYRDGEDAFLMALELA